MTHAKRFTIVVGWGFLAAWLLLGCSNTRPDLSSQDHGMTYRKLMLKDYDEMSTMVQKRIRAAHKLVSNSEKNSDWERDALLELISAERLICSRPDNDNMVPKLTLEVRREISGFGAYEDILAELTNESIKAFNSDEGLSNEMQTTYLFIFENIMSEIKPEVVDNARQRAILEQIRDANIKVPYEVMRERKLISMVVAPSPSIEAQQILDDAGFGKKKKK